MVETIKNTNAANRKRPEPMLLSVIAAIALKTELISRIAICKANPCAA